MKITRGTRWRVFAGVWIQSLFTSATAYFSLFAIPMTNMFGWSQSDFSMVSATSPIAQNQIHQDAMTAALCVSIMTLANMFGRIGFGFIYDKLKGWNSLILVLLINGISMIMLTFADNLPYFIICICLVGFSFGGLLVVFAPIVKNVFGSKYYNRNYGLIFIGYGIGAFVGPKISAGFYDSTNSYVMGFIGSAVLAAAAIILVFVARKLAAKMQEKDSVV